MPVSLKYDSHQAYQRAAIDAVLDLFEGGERMQSETQLPGTSIDGGLFSRPGELPLATSIFANSLQLTADELAKNLRSVQDRPSLPPASRAPGIPEELRQPISPGTTPTDFSVEMETGTGKTYVYLRTIFELHQKHGFSKFVVVVPTVAVREGVRSALRSMAEHLSDLYHGVQYDSFTYHSQHISRLRHFATSSHLQILIINIDAFSGDNRIISRPTDQLGGYAPLEYLRLANPILILDEPQNLESDRRRDAIRSLNGLVTLRYSATHRSVHHLVFRLTPVDAYDMGLVKKIDVLSVSGDSDNAVPHFSVLSIRSSSAGVSAICTLDRQTANGIKRVQQTLHRNNDLAALSNREFYRGWIVEDIHVDPPRVEFQNGVVVAEGRSTSQDGELFQRMMIREAIAEHFSKELELLKAEKTGLIGVPMKPLTLFFLDRVSSYAPEGAKYRVWFEDEYERLRNDERYSTLTMPSASSAHAGYFAHASNGQPRDVAVDAQSDATDSAYELIMRNNEKLLSLEEPTRFIFSHSALAEGWDNPNVFVICTLRETRSQLRKRQQLGRGLRLPVLADGNRCTDEDINHLTVVANESFARFAGDLQSEIENDTGIVFEGRIKDKRERVQLEAKPGFENDPKFLALWEVLAARTQYTVEYDAERMVSEAARRLRDSPPLLDVGVQVAKGALKIDSAGIGVELSRLRWESAQRVRPGSYDVLGAISNEVPVSRVSVKRILAASGRLEDALRAPAQLVDLAISSIRGALSAELVRGIRYRRIPSLNWPASYFIDRAPFAYRDKLVPVQSSVYGYISFDSEVERLFAIELDARDDIQLFVKLPAWYKVPTPIGAYNPDWAIVKQELEGDFVYLVRETKGSSSLDDLFRESERWKIEFGKAHFSEVGVDYAVVHAAQEV